MRFVPRRINLYLPDEVSTTKLQCYCNLVCLALHIVLRVTYDAAGNPYHVACDAILTEFYSFHADARAVEVLVQEQEHESTEIIQIKLYT